ncbi:MAG: PD-(D/E)XK nuclease family protein, partial [Alloprevotella sp.]
KHFLELVADDLIQRIGPDLSHTAVIFPNKRASLFFNEQLLPADGRPVWSPRYLTINELFLSLTDKRVADPIDTVCRLYQHYTRLTGSNETLDFFYGWGERLLADFDDIDKNRADAAKVFRDLRDYGELESHDFLTDEQVAQLNRFVHDFSREKLTHLRTNFSRLWNHLFELYQALRGDLAQTGEAYEGQLFREVAEALERQALAVPDELQHVAFVGFNVIDRVEHTLFSVLQREGRALFYWDYDTYYARQDCTATLHEAGLFMQANLRDFPNALDEASGCFDNLMRQRHSRTLRYIGAPTELAQAQYVAQWLGDPAHFNPMQGRRTAVVLCNEALLQPVLHALPSQVSEVNITKGFQLSHTRAYAFLQRQMRQIEAELDAEAVRRRSESQTHGRFVLPVGEACLPYLQRLLQQTSGEARKLGQAPEADDPQMRVLDTEAFFQTYTTLNRMARLVECGRLPVQLATLFRLTSQVLRSTTIPFHGEPAVGLQVMGVLETRCLDFDNLLMLSVGEGVLPTKGNDGSFIPYLIRKQHRLTTPDRQVAVYAYYFHRLLQRAGHAELLYNTSTEGMNRGEMSRFMRALLVEAEGRLPIQHAVLESTPRCVSLSPVVQAAADAGQQPLLTRISPSALKCYFKCPLQFYYHYIERLDAPQADDPIINANDFGAVFHRAAERLFTEHFDARTRPVTPEAIKQFLQQGGSRLLAQLTNECFDELHVPAHHITARAAASYLSRLLTCEAGEGRHGRLPAQWFRVLDAEQEHRIT